MGKGFAPIDKSVAKVKGLKLATTALVVVLPRLYTPLVPVRFEVDASLVHCAPLK